MVSAALTEIGVPVVLDPVLAAGNGKDLAAAGLIQAIRGLLPQITLTTPNRVEARRLTDEHDTTTAAQKLIELGSSSVLITGADEASGDQVLNRLYEAGQPPVDLRCRRLEGRFHGSGCTLSSACAAYIAHGAAVTEAATKAQEYTWTTLQNAHRPGHGQSLPNRIDR